ncbi:MAG TPA: DMT family transporter [Acidimicrobiales bacterium]|nr:DMT family transporter [Acidimicrobiales bacterium]
MSPPTTKTWIAPYLGIGLAWGCSFLFIKLSLDFLTPFGVAFLRSLFGAITLVTISRVRRVPLPRDRTVWWHLWVVALFINVVPGVLFALAETRTSSIVAGIINAMTPLTTLFFLTVVFRDERINRHQVIGLAFGLTGVLTVLGVWRGLGANPWWAVAALLAAVTCYGVSFPYARRHLSSREIEPVALASVQLILASLTLAPTFLFDGLNTHAPTVRSVAAILALGVFGSGLAFMWNFQVIAAVGSSVASTVTYLTPVVAVMVGVVFLHESLVWYEPVGGLLVVIGAAIGQGRLQRRR